MVHILKISSNDPYLLWDVIFIATSLVIVLCRPYKKMYMNVLDSLLLAHLGIVCHLISSYPGFQYMDDFVYTSLSFNAGSMPMHHPHPPPTTQRIDNHNFVLIGLAWQWRVMLKVGNIGVSTCMCTSVWVWGCLPPLKLE